MPHLSPLPWLSLFVFFWSILLMLNAMLWWHQLVTFPLISNTPTKSPFSSW